jgi:hypothetical protein
MTMTPEDRRTAALSLIYDHAVMGLPVLPMLRRVREACADYRDPDDLGRLMGDLLDMFAAAAHQLRPTDFGTICVGALISHAAGNSENFTRQAAASMILSHDLFGTDGADTAEMRDMGAEAFNAEVELANEQDRAPELVLAVIDVWTRVLPELTIEAGYNWLKSYVTVTID